MKTLTIRSPADMLTIRSPADLLTDVVEAAVLPSLLVPLSMILFASGRCLVCRT